MSGQVSEVQAQVPKTQGASCPLSLILLGLWGAQVVPEARVYTQHPASPGTPDLGGCPSSLPQPLVQAWLGWVSQGTSLGSEAEARQGLRCKFRERLGKRVKATLLLPSVGGGASEEWRGASEE